MHQDSDDNIVQTNTITDNAGNGIYMYNDCDDNEISRNIVRRNGGGGTGYAGIYLDGLSVFGCDDNTIERNTVFDNNEYCWFGIDGTYRS